MVVAGGGGLGRGWGGQGAGALLLETGEQLYPNSQIVKFQTQESTR